MSPKHYTELPHAHYLTFSCYKKLWLFKSPILYKLFLDNLDKVRQRQPFKLYGFVLMPNHIHLLIFPHSETNLSSLLTAIKSPFAKKALIYLQKHQPQLYAKLKLVEKQKESWRFWQAGGGYDRNIYSEEAFIKTLKYIHLNPVKKGLVTSPLDWMWSSAQHYHTGTSVLIKIDPPDWR